MPFTSTKQERYLFMNPETRDMAKKWRKKYGDAPGWPGRKKKKNKKADILFGLIRLADVLDSVEPSLADRIEQAIKMEGNDMDKICDDIINNIEANVTDIEHKLPLRSAVQRIRFECRHNMIGDHTALEKLQRLMDLVSHIVANEEPEIEVNASVKTAQSATPCQSCHNPIGTPLMCNSCGFTEALLCPTCTMKKYGGNQCPDCGDKISQDVNQ